VLPDPQRTTLKSLTEERLKIRSEVDDRIEPVLIDKAHDESGFFETIKKTGIKI